jgi:predicted RNase H-like nuclease (RuvC/YqgF family)
MKRYNKILDIKYGELNEKREATEMNAFRSRMASIKDSTDGDFKIKREKNFLKEKIERLKSEIRQYENNMSIFTGKGADALRKDIEKKIKASEREIDDIKKKMQLLDA